MFETYLIWKAVAMVIGAFLFCFLKTWFSARPQQPEHPGTHPEVTHSESRG